MRHLRTEVRKWASRVRTRRDTESAEGFGRKRDRPFATLAGYEYALRLDLMKKRPPLGPVDVPESDFVTAHLSTPSSLGKTARDRLACL
jgi:hypothetical protein